MARSKKPAPFSLRLTFEERAKLEEMAGDRPLGEYIRERLFEGDETPRKKRVRRPVKDNKWAAQLLAHLGSSRLANNINQLARAANSGSLPFTPETEAQLSEACHEVRYMRTALLRALGYQDEEPS